MAHKIALALAAWLLAGAPAAAQCFVVTQSGAAVFRSGLTRAQSAAARAQGKASGCSLKPVANGTPGAIDADQARALLPELRKHFAGAKSARGAKAKAVKAARRAASAKPGARGTAAPPLPVARPAAAPAPAPAIVAPLAPAPQSVLPAEIPEVAAVPPDLSRPPAAAPKWWARARAWLRAHW